MQKQSAMNAWQERLALWAIDRKDQIALRDERNTITYYQLYTLCQQVHQQLKANGIESKNRIVIVSSRDAVNALFLVTLLCFEYTALVLDPKMVQEDIMKAIERCRPQAIITNHNGLKILNESATLINLPLLNLGSNARLIKMNAPTNGTPAELRWLLSTSGTTGTAKLVMLSETNLIHRTQTEITDFSLHDQDRLLNCLPFSHDLGLNQLLTSLYSGCSLVIKSNSLIKMTEYLDKYQITGITGTPLVWRDFLKTVPRDYRNQILRYLTVSGGSLMKSYLQELQKVFPNARIIRTYGQTETFRTFINYDIEDPSLGRLITDTHVELTTNKELIHYGPTSMLGYLFEETVHERSPHWGFGVNTKDVMVFEKGNYHFQSRSDDVVKRFEQRFHLSEIEHFFRSLPGVTEAIAVTTPTDSADWRQYYLAVFILPNEESNLDINLLSTIAESGLSYYKKPDHLFLISEIPQTSSYKVDRTALKLRLHQELDRA